MGIEENLFESDGTEENNEPQTDDEPINFSNSNKQFKYVRMHEESQFHINSKIAQVMFLQKKSMSDILVAQEK